MKIERILFHNFGEISYTKKDAWKPAGDLSLDYTETDTRLLSSDDWRLIKTVVTVVREVELPDWMNPECYCRYELRLNWIWNAHKLAKAQLTETQTQALMLIYDRLGYEAMIESVKLLCANLRSNFKQSLKDQLEKWINELDTEEGPKYASPFSPKQVNALTQYTQGYRRY